ncbi:MAG: prepilin-type N-terminal cleavage/methylation domain-containing protein [Burkholderiales bacterium]
MRGRGFTLIELAVVLVIISLLMLVLFKGSTLIGTGQSQQVLAAVKDLGAGVTQFRSTYSYLPGDMPDASTRLPGVALCNPVGAPTTANGNGNGRIDAAEVQCVTEHLFRAGIIKSNAPITFSTSRGIVTLRVIARSASALGGSFSSSTRNLIEVATVPCQIALDLDAKTDDGNFSTGNTRASVASCTVDGANDPVPLIAIGL